MTARGSLETVPVPLREELVGSPSRTSEGTEGRSDCSLPGLRKGAMVAVLLASSGFALRNSSSDLRARDELAEAVDLVIWTLHGRCGRGM